jgi:5-methylcytosine-specific restriction protein B
MQNLSPSEIGIEERITVPEIKPKNIITFHPSFSYEEFIEGIMPSIGTDGAIQYQVKEGIFKAICRTAYNSLLHYLSIEKIWNADSDIPSLTPEEKDQLYLRAQELPHFLMIDEINRGDISRILGELITLLERDKRACSPNELSVTLPYSRTRFAIPPNLYIIGTMNTADKSIALVDVALRRRFGFIEMLPDQTILREYLSHDSLEIQKIFTLAINLLEEINIRIIKEFDRDHQLGHSYLMRLKDCSSREEAVSEFWSIWYDEMMPLLQEYFYDAPTRLHAVIGEGFVEYNTHSLIIHPDKDEEEFLTALQMILDTDPR